MENTLEKELEIEQENSTEDESETTQEVVGKLGSKLREIDVSNFSKSMQGFKVSTDLGNIPTIEWLPIVALRVNDVYQREVRANGRTNVIQIAKNFKWSKFGVVLVAAVGNGTFAIIDGQHRTLGAAIRGIDAVPCLILHGVNIEQQAEIFAAINGKVTAISALSIFHAELASKDPMALRVQDLCKEAGVTVCRYVKPLDSLLRGETVSVNTLKTVIQQYGEPLVKLALKCILKASGDHTVLLNSNVIRAMCHTLDAEGTFRVPEYRLISMMERFNLHDEWVAAHSDAKAKRKFVAGALAVRIFKFLDSELN